MHWYFTDEFGNFENFNYHRVILHILYCGMEVQSSISDATLTELIKGSMSIASVVENTNAIELKLFITVDYAEFFNQPERRAMHCKK